MDHDGFHSATEFFVYPEGSATLGALIVLAGQVPTIVSTKRHKFEYITYVKQLQKLWKVDIIEKNTGLLGFGRFNG